MGLAETFSSLQKRAERQLDVLNSKEKTAHALLLPFFDAMEYDPFNIHEVEPGRTLDVGEDGPMKADYTVRVDGTPAMLFQCRKADADLGSAEAPLLRHLGELDASLVVLTNGTRYRFYADLGGEDPAETRPFFEFNLFDFESAQTAYLQRLTKSAFDAQEVLASAFELKYTRLLQNYLVRQQESPDEHFVRFLAAQIYDGQASEDVLERFQPVVQNFLRRRNLEKQELRQVPAGRSDGRKQSNNRAASRAVQPSEETSQTDKPTASSVERARVDVDTGGDEEPSVQKASADQHENGEPAEPVNSEVSPSDVSSEETGSTEEEASTDEPVAADEAPPTDEDEPDSEAGERESIGGEDGGDGNLAEEFATKVLGDS